ncbi:MAG: T9SS type A sorting domain-containing protein [Candidatus Kapaibacterium sp.]
MKKLVTVLVLITVFGSLPASAQLEWHVTHTDADWRSEYCFSSISCSGDTCAATGLLIDHLKDRIYMMCWRSTNSGLTWNMQDPGLPFERGQNQNQLRLIQQIDGMNVVVVSDSGFMIRTFDGGKTWEQQDCTTKDYIQSIHFSDPLTGIFNTYTGIYTTTDGGRHWNNSHINRSGLYAIHSYGDGKYQAFILGNGPILRTSDNWKTIDSSKPLIDDSTYARLGYFFEYCFFGRGNTIIIAGRDTGKSGGVIIRSSDGGNTWDAPFRYTGNWFNVRYLSSPDKDTIVGTGWMTNQILISTDHGKQWVVDSLILDTTYRVYYSPAIAHAGEGRFVAVLAPAPMIGIQAIIARTGSLPAKVESDISLLKTLSIYPNPASSKIHILSRERSGEIEITDVVGRTVLREKISGNIELTLDISMLSPGAYTVNLDHSASQKLVVTGGE